MIAGFVCGALVLASFVATYFFGRKSAWEAVDAEEIYRFAIIEEYNQQYGALSQKFRDLIRDRDRLQAMVAGMEIDARRELEKVNSFHRAQLREQTEAARERARNDAQIEFADRIRDLADEYAETDEAEDDSE